MPSLRSSILLTVLKNRHLLRCSLKPETGTDWAESLPAVRARAAKAAAAMGKPPKDLALEPVSLNGLAGEWLRPLSCAPETQDGSVLLYFRGGGYVLGTLEMHRPIVAKFVRATGLPTLHFDYRLGPEHPFPAALEDGMTAYRWLLAQGHAPERILLAGDSAGGGLLLATLLALKDAGDPLPAAAAALSPFTDLACTGQSLTTNRERCISPKDSWIVCRDHYMAGQDPTHPYASPLYGDLTGLPPLFLCAGGHETLLDDSTRFAAKASEAGVATTLLVGEGMCHCYPALAPLFPEAREALGSICAFLRSHAAG